MKNKILDTDNHKIGLDPQDKHLSMDSLNIYTENLGPIQGPIQEDMDPATVI